MNSSFINKIDKDCKMFHPSTPFKKFLLIDYVIFLSYLLAVVIVTEIAD